ncbi:hypothetical protein DI291_0415 [Bacillus paralicheniformis]|nr:hypothetical protein DI291_0415 [Bacillus paralicheniformis]
MLKVSMNCNFSLDLFLTPLQPFRCLRANLSSLKELGISRSNMPRIEKRALMKIFHGFFRAEKEESLEKVISQKPA